jgi:hypothetical protein
MADILGLNSPHEPIPADRMQARYALLEAAGIAHPRVLVRREAEPSDSPTELTQFDRREAQKVTRLILRDLRREGGGYGRVQ